MNKQDVHFGIALLVSVVLSAVIAFGGQTLAESNAKALIERAASSQA